LEGAGSASTINNKYNKIGKMSSLEYTQIPKVFFTPHSMHTHFLTLSRDYLTKGVDGIWADDIIREP
jgi:hypothetical protein